MVWVQTTGYCLCWGCFLGAIISKPKFGSIKAGPFYHGDEQEGVGGRERKMVVVFWVCLFPRSRRMYLHLPMKTWEMTKNTGHGFKLLNKQTSYDNTSHPALCMIRTEMMVSSARDGSVGFCLLLGMPTCFVFVSSLDQKESGISTPIYLHSAVGQPLKRTELVIDFIHLLRDRTISDSWNLISKILP